MSIIKGKVNELFEAEISLEIISSKEKRTVNLVIDTGFNGDLVLPESLIKEFNFSPLYRMEVELVGDITKEVDFFKGQIKWLNSEILNVQIIADNSFLIGTNLLKSGKLWIDYQAHEVIITKTKL